LGFFISGRPTLKVIQSFLKNSQRLFVKEDMIASNVLYKIKGSKKEVWDNNNDKIVVTKNSFGFTSHNDYHKQLLLGFMNEKATDAIDYGYDATSLTTYLMTFTQLTVGN
jgi:hypothetical protein